MLVKTASQVLTPDNHLAASDVSEIGWKAFSSTVFTTGMSLSRVGLKRPVDQLVLNRVSTCIANGEKLDILELAAGSTVPISSACDIYEAEYGGNHYGSPNFSRGLGLLSIDRDSIRIVISDKHQTNVTPEIEDVCIFLYRKDGNCSLVQAGTFYQNSLLSSVMDARSSYSTDDFEHAMEILSSLVPDIGMARASSCMHNFSHLTIVPYLSPEHEACFGLTVEQIDFTQDPGLFANSANLLFMRHMWIPKDDNFLSLVPSYLRSDGQGFIEIDYSNAGQIDLEGTIQFVQSSLGVLNSKVHKFEDEGAFVLEFSGKS